MVWWRLESLTGIVKFLMRVHFVISCGVTRKKLILGPSVHVALGGFLVRGWHRRYTTMLFVVRVIYCIICIICCCLHEFCYILWLFLVQSHKQPRSCVSSTPACARGFEIHVSRQGPCDSEFVNLHSIYSSLVCLHSIMASISYSLGLCRCGLRLIIVTDVEMSHPFWASMKKW